MVELKTKFISSRVYIDQCLNTLANKIKRLDISKLNSQANLISIY